jgi:hypothetical protein
MAINYIHLHNSLNGFKGIRWQLRNFR